MARISELLAKPPEPEKSIDKIFVEEPVPLSVFMRDKKYLANPALSDVQYAAVRHMEQVLYPATYDLMVEAFGDYWKPVRYVNEARLQWGKGSGKDHICRIISLRVAHILLCLRSPQDYYDFPSQDSIHLLNVARSSGQANRAFFQPMKRAIERTGGWFEDKAATAIGSIVYDKNIEAISGHSDAETQEGLNILVGVADEIDAFKSREEVEQARGAGLREPSTSADAVLSMMRSSARTRFPQVMKIAVISYPRFKGSTIQQLTEEGLADNERKGNESKIYVSGPLATWEVNPRVKGKEDFQDDYDTDPDMAAAKYECKPGFSTNLFFRNAIAIKHAFSQKLDRQPIEIEYYWGLPQAAEEAHGPNLKPSWCVRFHISPDLRPISGAYYAIHGDIGITADRAGVAMAHVKSWEEKNWLTQTEDGEDIDVFETRPVVKLDFVTSFTADLTARPVAREVQIRWYRELAWELIRKGFAIKRYTFDGFQSTDAMQILEQRGIETQRVSTDMNNDVWNNLRDLAYDGRLEAYDEEPHLKDEDFGLTVREILSLSRKPNGKVDHPPYGSKDQADAAGGAALGAIVLGGSEEEGSPEAQVDDELKAFESQSSAWTANQPLGAMPWEALSPTPPKSRPIHDQVSGDTVTGWRG